LKGAASIAALEAAASPNSAKPEKARSQLATLLFDADPKLAINSKLSV
jgi:hypothetical protein